MRLIRIAATLSGFCMLASAGAASAATPRREYRVVYAPAKDLGSRLEAAGREGYACVAVARPDPGVAPGGVVVVVGRTAGASVPVANRALVGGWGKELQDSLERAGSEGFRLCGIVLDESGSRSMVTVLSKRGDAAPAHYLVEILKVWKESLARLKDRAAEGFQPVAAAPIDDNRVPEMRSWLVVVEKTDGAPRDVTVRSNSGPEGLQKALNENGAQGYRVEVVWKEGNDVVAMMSRPRDAKSSFTFTVDAASVDKIHWLSGFYLGDVPHKGDERIVVRQGGVSASTDVEDDPLPALGRSGAADAEALEVLGNHLGRHAGFTPAAARIRRGPGGTFVLTTILVSRS